MNHVLHDESVRATVFVAIEDPALHAGIKAAIDAAGVNARFFPTSHELIHALASEAPSCLILDTRQADGDGFGTLAHIKQVQPYCAPAIFVSGAADVPSAVAAMKIPGVVYFFVSPLPHQLMVEQISHAVASDRQARGQMAKKQRSAAALSRLSPREREVLQGLMLGKPNKQIAAEFNVSVKTVATHRANILEKLNVGSLVALVHAVEAA